MAFNINAQVVLSGPKNIKAVTQQIRSQLSNVNVNVNLNVPKTAQSQITNLNKQLTNFTNTSQKFNNRANQTSTALTNVGKQSKQAASAMSLLGKETALTFKRFAAAGIVTATVFRLTTAIGEAVPKALELQREFVKLQQVTGKTQAQLSGLNVAVRGLSVELGLGAGELASIARIFAQTGQSLDQIESSLRAVARASLAPTFGEMEQTAEGLIAALNQFGISASKSEAVLASINRVSKKFAVESEDLISAIRRAGGVFAVAAGQFAKPEEALNQFIGIFTSVRSVTRESSETIATGLRTIFSRIQRPQTIEFLRQLGINLKDAEGNFVGLFQAFRILSTELDGIIARGDTLALSKVVEELGGIRQVGKLIPAIREFRRAESAFNEAQQGALEGLGGDVGLGLTPLIKQFEILSSRFQDFIQRIADSGTFTAFAKTAIGLANAFLSVGEALTPLLPTLTTLAGIKISQALGGFASGFFGSFGAGGGLSAAGSNLGSTVTGGGRGGSSAGGANNASIQNNTSALNINNTELQELTVAVSSIRMPLIDLRTSISTLNNTIRTQRPSPRGFASGGLVPGSGNRDTVPAMLTPGEFVVRKSAVKGYGLSNLAKINGYKDGGIVGNIDDPFTIGVLKSGAGNRSLGGVGVNVTSIVKEGGNQARLALEKSLLLSRGGKESNALETSGVTDAELDEFVKSGQNRDTGGKPRRTALINKVSKKTGISPRDLGRSGLSDKGLNARLSKDDVKNLLRNVDTTLANQKINLKELGAGAKITASGGNQVSLDAGAREALIGEGGVLRGLPQALAQATAGLGPELQTDAGDQIENLISKSGIGSIEGYLFEAFLKSATRDLIADNAKDAVDGLFDVVGNEEAYKKLFAGFKVPGELKNSDAESQIASAYGKAVKNFGVQFFNNGGFAQGTDTVPAMLTPGEYVINKKSAKAFGYGNLKAINRYNQGGVVRRGRHAYGIEDAFGSIDVGAGIPAAQPAKGPSKLEIAQATIDIANGDITTAGGGEQEALPNPLPVSIDTPIQVEGLQDLASSEASIPDILSVDIVGFGLSSIPVDIISFPAELSPNAAEAAGPKEPDAFQKGNLKGAKVEPAAVPKKETGLVPADKGKKKEETFDATVVGDEFDAALNAIDKLPVELISPNPLPVDIAKISVAGDALGGGAAAASPNTVNALPSGTKGITGPSAPSAASGQLTKVDAAPATPVGEPDFGSVGQIDVTTVTQAAIKIENAAIQVANATGGAAPGTAPPQQGPIVPPAPAAPDPIANIGVAAPVDTSAAQKSMDSLAESAEGSARQQAQTDLNTAATGQQMLNLAFGVQGLLGTLEGFKDGIDAADVLNLASQLALIGPAIVPAIASLKGLAGSLVTATTSSGGLSSAFNTNILTSKAVDTANAKQAASSGLAAAADADEALATAAATTADLGEATASGAAAAADATEASFSLSTAFKDLVAGFVTAIAATLTLVGAKIKESFASVAAALGLNSVAAASGGLIAKLATLNFAAVGAGLAIGAMGIAAGETARSFTDELIGGEKETIAEGPDGRAVQGRRGMSEEEAAGIGAFSSAIGIGTAALVSFGIAVAIGAGPVTATVAAIVALGYAVTALFDIFQGTAGLQQAQFNAVLAFNGAMDNATEVIENFANKADISADDIEQLATATDFGGKFNDVLTTTANVIANEWFSFTDYAQSAAVEFGASLVTAEQIASQQEAVQRALTESIKNQIKETGGQSALSNFRTVERTTTRSTVGGVTTESLGADVSFALLQQALDDVSGLSDEAARSQQSYKKALENLVATRLFDELAEMSKDMPEAEAEGFRTSLFKLNQELSSKGLNLATASSEDLLTTINDLDLTQAGFTETVLAQKDAIESEEAARVAAGIATERAAFLTSQMKKSLDALAAGLSAFSNIADGAAGKFQNFVDSFQAGFEAAFSSEATLQVPERINPFDNLDFSSVEDIEKAFERISANIGSQNQPAIEGLEETVIAAKELPMALKKASEQIGVDAEFENEESFIDAVRDNLDGFSDLPKVVQANLESGLRAEFQNRQGGSGGAIRVDEILTDEGGEAARALADLSQKTAEAAGAFTNSLNQMEKAVIQAAQVQIDLIKKQKEAGLKEIEIRERLEDTLGKNEGRNPLAVANERLDRRVRNAAGLGATDATDAKSLIDRRRSLIDQEQGIRSQLGIGADVSAEDAANMRLAGQDELVKKLAEVTEANKGTQAALDILANDTTKLAAIQQSLADIEKKKLGAEDFMEQNLLELQKAIESGDMTRVRELQAEMAAPSAILNKINEGGAISLEESTQLLGGGLKTLVGTGALSQEEADDLRSQILRGSVDSGASNLLFGSFSPEGREKVKTSLRDRMDEKGKEDLENEAAAIAAEQQAAVQGNLAIATDQVAKMQKNYNKQLYEAEAGLRRAGAALLAFRADALEAAGLSEEADAMRGKASKARKDAESIESRNVERDRFDEIEKANADFERATIAGDVEAADAARLKSQAFTDASPLGVMDMRNNPMAEASMIEFQKRREATQRLLDDPNSRDMGPDPIRHAPLSDEEAAVRIAAIKAKNTANFEGIQFGNPGVAMQGVPGAELDAPIFSAEVKRQYAEQAGQSNLNQTLDPFSPPTDVDAFPDPFSQPQFQQAPNPDSELLNNSASVIGNAAEKLAQLKDGIDLRAQLGSVTVDLAQGNILSQIEGAVKIASLESIQEQIPQIVESIKSQMST